MDVAQVLQEIREELRSLRAEMRRGRVEPSALLTMKQAAARLGVGLTKLRSLVKRGEVQVTELGARQMVPLSEIERLSRSVKTPVRAAPRRKPAPSETQDSAALRRFSRSQRA